jgi:hypothetical protein
MGTRAGKAADIALNARICNGPSKTTGFGLYPWV